MTKTKYELMESKFLNKFTLLEWNLNLKIFLTPIMAILKSNIEHLILTIVTNTNFT